MDEVKKQLFLSRHRYSIKWRWFCTSCRNLYQHYWYGVTDSVETCWRSERHWKLVQLLWPDKEGSESLGHWVWSLIQGNKFKINILAYRKLTACRVQRPLSWLVLRLTRPSSNDPSSSAHAFQQSVQSAGWVDAHTHTKTKTEFRGRSPQTKYTDRATSACRRSWCQLMRIEGVAWSAQRTPTAVFSDF
jgi:hypothetical protein